MDADQRKVYESIVNGPRGRLVGPLRAVLLIPELARRWSHFGEYLRFSTSLPPKLKELAILVTARRWNSQVEWEIHSQAALDSGLDSTIVNAIERAAVPIFHDEAGGAVYEFARQLLMFGDVEDAAHDAIVALWDEVGVVELTSLIGYYSMVSLMLNAQAIPTTNGRAALQMPQGPIRLTDIPPCELSR
jgi:4-carboxymuconolactone decarboxylase